jgi:hypothetical protein
LLLVAVLPENIIFHCCCHCCCRVGGLLSPFAAIHLVAAGAPAAAEGVFAAACLAACGAVLVIDSKHDSGQPMEEEREEAK